MQFVNWIYQSDKQPYWEDQYFLERNLVLSKWDQNFNDEASFEA